MLLLLRHTWEFREESDSFSVSSRFHLWIYVSFWLLTLNDDDEQPLATCSQCHRNEKEREGILENIKINSEKISVRLPFCSFSFFPVIVRDGKNGRLRLYCVEGPPRTPSSQLSNDAGRERNGNKNWNKNFSFMMLLLLRLGGWRRRHFVQRGNLTKLFSDLNFMSIYSWSWWNIFKGAQAEHLMGGSRRRMVNLRYQLTFASVCRERISSSDSLAWNSLVNIERAALLLIL